MKTVSNVLIKNLGSGIKKVIINDPKTYNSLILRPLVLTVGIFFFLIPSCLA